MAVKNVSFIAALVNLRVDVARDHDDGRYELTISGLPELRAAHKASIREAVEAERARCVKAVQSVGGPGQEAHVAAILGGA